MTKTSRYKGLVLGSFLVPEIDMIFGDGVGASLVRGPYCQFGVGLIFYIGTAQLKKVLGWAPKRTSKEAPDSITFGPRAKETLKRGQKVDLLEIKSGPPWRVQFWPLHCGKFVEAFISS